MQGGLILSGGSVNKKGLLPTHHYQGRSPTGLSAADKHTGILVGTKHWYKAAPHLLAQSPSRPELWGRSMKLLSSCTAPGTFSPSAAWCARHWTQHHHQNWQPIFMMRHGWGSRTTLRMRVNTAELCCGLCSPEDNMK